MHGLIYWPDVDSLSQQHTLGFSVRQSPVSSPWMQARPVFYLQLLSIGITAPKAMATLDWKLPPPALFLSGCTPAQIIYCLTNTLYNSAATNKWGKYVFDLNKVVKQEPTISWRSRAWFFTYAIACGTFSHGREEQNSGQSKGFAAPNMSTLVYLHWLILGLFIFVHCFL